MQDPFIESCRQSIENLENIPNNDALKDYIYSLMGEHLKLRDKPVMSLDDKIKMYQKARYIVDHNFDKDKIDVTIINKFEQSDNYDKDNYIKSLSNYLKQQLRNIYANLMGKDRYENVVRLMFVKENIMYLCLECHDEKTRGHHSDVTTKRIEYLKAKYDK